MPDLSEMLGAVYGGADESTKDEPAEPAGGPAWADDDHLDRAFAEWTPGPGADAPAAERSMFAPAPDAPAPRLADDLAAALSEAVLAKTDTEDDTSDAAAPAPPVPAHFAPAVPAVGATAEPAAEPAVSTSTLADLEPEPEPEPAPVPIPVHKAGWQRSDDDIIPTGRSARGRGGRPVRAPKRAKAPKPAKADTGPTPTTGGKAPKADKPKGKGLKREISFSFGKKK